MIRKFDSAKKFPLLLMPATFWFVFFLMIPLFFVLLFSFLHKGDFGKIEYMFDLKNYQKVIEWIYLKMIFRSVILAGFTTVSCFILAFPLAYFMARSSKTLKSLFLCLVIVPFWTNFIIRVYALKIFFGDSGFLNQLLISWGLIDSSIPFIDNLNGVAIGMVYNYLPFMILPLYVNLEKFDFTLLDAAYDLGANRFQTLLKILLPLSSSGIITGCLFVFIPAFGEFVIPDLLGGSQNMYVGNLITDAFLKNRDWPFGSALSALLVALSLLSFVITSKKKEARESHGIL